MPAMTAPRHLLTSSPLMLLLPLLLLLPADAADAGGAIDVATQRHRSRALLRDATARPRCVCAFDFDLTLRVPRQSGDHVDYDARPAEARDVVAACQRAGCGVGVASANADRDKLVKVLSRGYGDQFATSSFFGSQAFQYGSHDKAASLRRLADHFGAPTSCTVLFDDLESNRKYAQQVGARFEHVRPDRGVQLWNWDRAAAALPGACGVRQP